MRMSAFGEWLQDQRKERNISQTEMATALKRRQPTISKIETGDLVPSPSIMMDIAKVFGMSIDEVIAQNAISVEAGGGFSESDQSTVRIKMPTPDQAALMRVLSPDEKLQAILKAARDKAQTL
jgi:transcriptional regulator with XRE-family HTH domain